MLNNKIDAIIRVLSKEGITTKEEVEEATKDITENGEKDE